MIEGIEILNKYELTEIVTYPIFNTICLISLFVFIISLVVSLIVTNSHKDVFKKVLIVLVISAGAVCLISGMCSGIKHTVNTGKYAYQVTISDSVSMNEFTEIYEILDIDGKIYTVEYKNMEEK